MKTIVILTGGKSSRMGTDKTFLLYHGVPFLENMLQKAGSEFDQVLISAGSHEHALEIRKFLNTHCTSEFQNIPVLEDLYDSIGPMGGLLSVFEQTSEASFAVIAIDLPCAQLKVLSFLSDQLNLVSDSGDSDFSAAMFQSSAGKIETCAAVYNRSAYPKLKAAYEQGNYSLLKSIGLQHILLFQEEEIKRSVPSLSETDLDYAFQNVNTPKELELL